MCVEGSQPILRQSCATCPLDVFIGGGAFERVKLIHGGKGGAGRRVPSKINNYFPTGGAGCGFIVVKILMLLRTEILHTSLYCMKNSANWGV